MRAGSRDRGVTLIELLVAVTLMAVSFGAVFGGLGLAYRIQADQRSNTTIDTELRNYADRILAATYVACPTATQTSYSGVTTPTGLTTSLGIEFFTGAYDVNGAIFQPTCTGITTDQRVQRITVTLTDGRGVKGTLVFSKYQDQP